MLLFKLKLNGLIVFIILNIFYYFVLPIEFIGQMFPVTWHDKSVEKPPLLG